MLYTIENFGRLEIEIRTVVHRGLRLLMEQDDPSGLAVAVVELDPGERVIFDLDYEDYH